MDALRYWWPWRKQNTECPIGKNKLKKAFYTK
jgi:hypothetical protein